MHYYDFGSWCYHVISTQYVLSYPSSQQHIDLYYLLQKASLIKHLFVCCIPDCQFHLYDEMLMFSSDLCTRVHLVCWRLLSFWTRLVTFIRIISALNTDVCNKTHAWLDLLYIPVVLSCVELINFPLLIISALFSAVDVLIMSVVVVVIVTASSPSVW